MSRLSDLINEELTRAMDENPVVNAHAVAVVLMPRLEPEHLEQLQAEALADHIEAAMKRGRKLSLMMVGAGQAELPFGLDPAYSLGGRIIKPTSLMSQMEFNRCIAIREKSVADDMASLSRMRRARDATAPIFAVEPDLTMGEALSRVGIEADQAA